MRVFLLGLSLAVALCWPQTQIDDAEERMLGPLKRAGVDLDDEAALIRALHRTGDLGMPCSAAYALGKLPKTPAVLSELNAAALSEDEILMNYAIRSLLKHGDREWVDGAVARLPNVREDRQRLHLAGELARVGRFDGWDMIAAAIVTGHLWQRETALLEVGNFRGMKDASGKQIDLLATLDELAMRAPESARSDIFRAIVRIGVENDPELQRKRRSVAK